MEAGKRKEEGDGGGPLRGPTLRPPVRPGGGGRGPRASFSTRSSSDTTPARPSKPSPGPRGGFAGAAFLNPRKLPSQPPLLLFLPLLCLLICCCFPGSAQGRSSPSYEYSYGDEAAQKNGRITCYTCVNVSNNDECNRFAIDRPCPEGGDYCLTLHVMDALDRERSVLVNKRCASLDDCAGDSTGCKTAYGQTQCVSCCDQPYCNDSVPSNSTNAVFYSSSASSILKGKMQWNAGAVWRVAVVLITALKLSTLGGHS